jgi:hypothetical protein
MMQVEAVVKMQDTAYSLRSIEVVCDVMLKE